MTAPNPDPLRADEEWHEFRDDVPWFFRRATERPSDEEVAAMLRSRPIHWNFGEGERSAMAWSDGYGEGFDDGVDGRPGAIVWLLWAVSLLLAALAGALVRGML